MKTIYVINYEKSCKMIAPYLSSYGYEISCFSSSSKTLERIRNKLPDMLIADVEYPDIDGFQVVKEARIISSSL